MILKTRPSPSITRSQSLTENGKTIVYAEDKLKTKSSYRTLPLIPVVEEKLLEHKAKLERNQKLFGNSYCKEYMDYVCVDEMGKLFRPNFVSDHFGWLLKKYGLKKSHSKNCVTAVPVCW